MSELITAPYLDAANKIGNKLLKDAIHFDQLCNWQGAVLEPVKGQFQVVNRTCGPDLYNGLSGILWFLVELYQEAPSDLLLEAINASMQNIFQQTVQPKEEQASFSLHSGKLGVAYSLWRAGKQLQSDHWQQVGLNQFLELQPQDNADGGIDVISGAAGAIPVLLKVYQEADAQVLLSLAVSLANDLIKRATKTEHYWYWPEPDSPQGLTGYSHGNAGIGLAFLELHRVTNEASYLSAAHKAFNFERYHFDQRQANWPDLRAMNKTPVCNHMWCHGAPGVSISRLRAFQLTQDESYLHEAKTGLESTWQDLHQVLHTNPGQLNFSLCHGAAGNAEVLLIGGQFTGEQKYQQLAYQVADFGISHYINTDTDFPTGVNDSAGHGRSGEYTPGLMLGAAGTGLFYLHLQKPSEFESPLHIR